MNAAYWMERCQKLEALVYEKNKEIKRQERQLEDADDHAKFLEAERKRLKEEIKNLKTAMELQEKTTSALARIGAAVRVRYLEQAKSRVMGPTIYNSEFVRRGNDAAHRAYGSVDAALFIGTYLKDDEKAELEEVFRRIYNGLPPRDYGSLPPKMLEAIDYQGSIISFYAPHNGMISIKDRQAAGDSMQFIQDKQSELGDDAFENDKDVARHLKKLGDLADQFFSKSPYAANPGIPSTSYGPPQSSSPRKQPTSGSSFQSRRGLENGIITLVDHAIVQRISIYLSQYYHNHQLPSIVFEFHYNCPFST